MSALRIRSFITRIEPQVLRLATPESSTIARFDYTKDRQVLIVEFKDGARYNYFDVSEIVFQRMKTAPSKGQFLAQNIKGKYRYARA